jgi:hypothetical protein
MMDEKKRKRLERAEKARAEVENDEVGRRLKARIAYIERQLDEQRQAREHSARRGWGFWRFRRAG